MLLYLHRRFDEAEQALQKANALEPNNPQFLLGLALFYKERNEAKRALPFAEQLLKLRPQDQMYQQIRDEIRALPPASSGPSR
jgi:cytochrome c-type biogenesis protein CcmH/NrfG